MALTELSAELKRISAKILNTYMRPCRLKIINDTDVKNHPADEAGIKRKGLSSWQPKIP